MEKNREIIIPELCTWLKTDNNFCQRPRKENSFFCGLHYPKLYPSSKFSLIFTVKNYKEACDILLNNEINSKNFIKFSLLDPENRILYYDNHTENFKKSILECHIFFNASILKKYISHIYYENDVEKKKKIKLKYEDMYSLKENLNRWSHILNKNARLVNKNLFVPSNKISIESRIISLENLKTVFYPIDIFTEFSCTIYKEIFKGEILFKKFSFLEYLLDTYIASKRCEIVTGYSWTLSSKNQAIKDHIFNALKRPWNKDRMTSEKKCLENMNFSNIDIYEEWTMYDRYIKNPEKKWDYNVLN